jgi:3-oxoacyl-[acyl-carrier protein] reductase
MKVRELGFFRVAMNLSGTWSRIRSALPGMAGREEGRIIAISSELGLAGGVMYAAYCASKGGIMARTKTSLESWLPWASS